MSWTEPFLNNKVTLHFVKQSLGQKLLLNRDHYLKSLVDFDYQVRCPEIKEPTNMDFYKKLFKSVQVWEDEEIAVIGREYQKLQGRLEKFKLKWPNHIFLIKTDGSEEANACYVRSRNTIVFSQNYVDRIVEQSEYSVLFNKLWHLISRNNPELAQKMYQRLGFKLIRGFEVPDFITAHQITNPNMVDFNVVMQLEDESVGYLNVIPVWYYSMDQIPEGTSFFQFYVAELIVVEEIEPGSNCWRPRTDHYGELEFISPKDCQSFWDQVGENTNFINHPEAILAENFVELMLNPKPEELPTPELISDFKNQLLGKK